MTEYRKKQRIKTALLGDAGVGKTALANVFLSGKSIEELHTAATIACNFSVKDISYNGQDIMSFEIWDTCGMEKYRSITQLYYRESKVVLIVFSVDSKKSFESISYWRKELNEYLGSRLELRPLICVIANKIDLLNTERSQFTREDLDKIKSDMADLDSIYQETSALTKEGIEEIFSMAGKELDPSTLIKVPEEETRVDLSVGPGPKPGSGACSC